jgi:hypothetical protein
MSELRLGRGLVCTDMERTATDPGRMLEGLRGAGMGMLRGVMRRLRDHMDMDMLGGDMWAEDTLRAADSP